MYKKAKFQPKKVLETVLHLLLMYFVGNGIRKTLVMYNFGPQHFFVQADFFEESRTSQNINYHTN